MTLFWLVLGGFVLFGMVFTQLDRPSIPAWRVRDTYRWAALVLLLLLLLVSYKALRYHEELIFILRSCR